MDGEAAGKEEIREAARKGEPEAILQAISDPKILESYVRDLVTNKKLDRLSVLHNDLGAGVTLSRDDVAFLITFCSELAEDNRLQRKRVMELIGAFLQDSIRNQARNSMGGIVDFRRQGY